MTQSFLSNELIRSLICKTGSFLSAKIHTEVSTSKSSFGISQPLQFLKGQSDVKLAEFTPQRFSVFSLNKIFQRGLDSFFLGFTPIKVFEGFGR
jgi:hypothetical protein